ncbi:MAG: hypothetical protein RJA61_619 [Candidatus Parcubacteria bacterium]
MEKQNRYFLYVRKSSEGEDRQVQSIPDQIAQLMKLAKDSNLEIIETLEESKSAKSPGARPVFSKMLERIENGEANAILCWEINRLSRNPVDSGTIQWMLQQRILKSIRTINREYKPDDNALLLSVESGSANQFILDLKKGVKRGIDSKITKGHAPILAPLGYLNTKIEIRGENYIIRDKERFHIIRKIWDLMLTGNYTPPKILEIANNDWCLRTRKMRRRGGKPISRSTIYKILTNPFYYGYFVYSGQTYKGEHEAMISIDEYDKVQILLGREGRPRPKKHQFPFTGIIRCGECNSAITAIEKTKIIKSTGKLKTFTYYYCTRKKNQKCSQRKHTSTENLEAQIDSELTKLSILPEFKDLALEIIRENNDTELENRTKIYENQQKTLIENQKQLDNLTRMRYRELISDEEFIKEREQIQNQIIKIREEIKATEKRADDWIELTEKTFEFACFARSIFANGDINTKKGIFTALGQNYILKDQKLFISSNEWLKPISEQYPAIENEYRRLELGKNKSTQRQKDAFASLRPLMRGRADLNRRPLA